MISSFETKRFRGFEELKLEDLRLVNIVVGRSASGKTALLEGVRLALGGTPTIAWNSNSIRGLFLPFQPNPTREQFDSLWSPLFFDFDIEQAINFGITNSEGKKASLKIYFDKTNPTTPTLPGIPGMQTVMSTIIPLAFERTNFDNNSSILLGTINQQGHLQLDQGQELYPPAVFFSSTWQINTHEIAGWFSQLSITNQEKRLLNVVNLEFPEIVDLSVQAPSNVPVLYASVKPRSRKMPVSLISSGINKFIAVMMAILQFKGGAVIIDEIENGIYYAMFPSFWEAMYQFAKESNTQLFLSTHSWECLKAAVPLIEKKENDFCLIQISQANGSSHAQTIRGRDAAAAIESDIEVRR